MSEKMLPEFIRRDVERAIEAAIHPKGMNVHDGKALIAADRLQYMLNFIDALRTHENGGQESGSVQDAVDKFRALLADCTESEIQQAKAIFCEVLGVGGQESEAGAVAIVERIDAFGDSCFVFRRLPTSSDIQDGAKLYLAPPSAQAIETAAIMKCAEVVEGWASTASEYGFDGDMEQFMRVKSDLLALIPQDGRTALEEFGMKVAERTNAEARVCNRPRNTDDLRAIVTNLIGVPPLNSGTVSGEE